MELRGIWKKHMENLMNEDNVWDHAVSSDVAEGPALQIVLRYYT